MDKVRIGFVGVGNMGQAAHLRNYASIGECAVTAIAELRPHLREAVARKFNIPRTYETAAAMLAAEKLDGIVASQPFDRHGSIITPLYQAGIPLFTEKPLAASVGVGERMLSALAQSSSWHMVGYHKRSDPATMYAKAEIERLKESGELGPLKYVRITMPAGDWVAGGFSERVTADDPYPPSVEEPDDAPDPEYVRFVNYYIHQVNLMRHLLGEPYTVTYADPSEVLLAVQSESGVAGVIEMSPYRTTIDWQETALIAFEKGWIKIELPAPLAHNRPGRVEMYADPGDGKTPLATSPQLPWVHAMRQQAINFVTAIRGERKPPCDAIEALEDLKTAQDYMRLLRGEV